MLSFITTEPTRQTIRDYFNTESDGAVTGILSRAGKSLRCGANIDALFEQHTFTRQKDIDPAEELVRDWIADHLYGGGYINVDPAWMSKQLDTINPSAETPDPDVLIAMYLWVWWREAHLLALVKNQKRGLPLGTVEPIVDKRTEVTEYRPLPLHIVSGKVTTRCPEELSGKLHTLVERVHASIREPIWVLADASALRSAISCHYATWADWLESAGMTIAFNPDSIREAMMELEQPMEPPRGYAGPLNKYGVSFRAGSFFIAQSLALNTQHQRLLFRSFESNDRPHSPRRQRAGKAQ